MLLFDMLDQDNFIIVNKPLIFSLGHECTIIYQELVSRYRYFKKKNQLDTEGFFYNTVDDLYLGTGFTKKQQKKYIDQLIEKGLVIQENRKNFKGLRVRHFKIVTDESVLKTHIENGLNAIEELEKTLKIQKEEQNEYYKEYTSRNKKILSKVVEFPKVQNGTWGENTEKTDMDTENIPKGENVSWEREQNSLAQGNNLPLNKNNSNKTNLNNVVVVEEEKSQSDIDESKNNQIVENSVLAQNSKVGYQHIIEDVKNKLTIKFGDCEYIEPTLQVIESDFKLGKTIVNREKYALGVYQNIQNNDKIKGKKVKITKSNNNTTTNTSNTVSHKKTGFHNFEETFTKYDPDDLEAKILAMQEDKWNK